METIKIKDVVGIYRQLASISVPTSAKICSINDNFIVVSSQWSQRDIEKSEKITFNQNYILSTSDTSVLLKTPIQEVKNELWNKDSLSGQLKAVIQTWTNKKGDEKQFVEIWDNNRKIKNWDILFEEKHGKLYTNDGNFGSFQWSVSEDKILYVAEKKIPKTKSYFDKQQIDDKEEEEIVLGKEHDTSDTWGEQLVKKGCPVLCILDIMTGDIQVLDTPQHLSCGQALFSPADKGVIFTGWNHEPFRLGLKYCTQRQSGLFYYEFESGKTSLLSDEKLSARSPVVSHDQSKVVYLDQPIGGAHRQCSRLMLLDWKTKQKDVIIDLVHTVKDKKFCGIFTDTLPTRCWTKDSKYVIIPSNCRSNIVLYCINIETKSVQRLPDGMKNGSSNILDVYYDRILITTTAPNVPPKMMICKLDKPTEEIKWMNITESPVYDNIKYSVIQHTPHKDRINLKYDSLDYESIFISPKQETNVKPPLILFPHGGPHGTFDPSFMLYVAGFCQCGFAVLMVNYRGSLGFGQDSVESLLGNIGDQDVKDVKAAADSVIEQGLVDENRVVIFGGSHGGFLTTHLIGQYPNFFKAACCRNPVTNLQAMTAVTDIPDWVFVETGFDYNHSCLTTPQVLEQMWKRSPIRYIDKVKTPTLLMIGKDDLRVPPSQAKEYYRALKTRNVDTRLIEYEDNCHPIVKVNSEADAFVNIILWYQKYC